MTSALHAGEELLTVAVDNRIGSSTLPVGNDAGTAFMGSDNANVPAVAEAKSMRDGRICRISISSISPD